MRIKYFLCLLLLLFVRPYLIAQDSSASLIDVGKIRFVAAMFTSAEIAWIDSEIPASDIPKQDYQKNLTAQFQQRIPDTLLEKIFLMRFVLTNSGDTAKKVYFTPGFFTRSISLFKIQPHEPTTALVSVPYNDSIPKQYRGARLIEVQPGDTTIYYARFKMLRTNSNNFLARIVESDFFGSWLHARKISDTPQDTVTYIVSGILLLMIFYSLAVYHLNKSREFLYYSGYAFCTGVLLFLKAILSHRFSEFNFLFEEYLDFIIMCAGIFLYFIFVRKFLNTAAQHPFLEKFFRICEIVLISLLIIFSSIYLLTNRYVILNLMENYIIKFLLFIIGITFIVYSIKKKNKLLNYLAAGNSALVLFSIISLLVMLFKPRIIPDDPTHILNRSLFYYEVGLVLELMLFLAGLAYKNRNDLIEQVKEKERIKLENERQEFEKQMAVMAAQQDERNRISADMHDELGSGVTAIRLMSEIVKSKMKEQSLPEIDKISNSANDLLGKMNTIIWTMKSSNDSLESLAAYVRAYAIEYFDSTSVNCYVNVSIKNNLEISGEKRRNIFLSIKEALNNILKHAQATQVSIDLIADESKLVVLIKDNGKGIDLENLRRFGNGLSNIKKRMQTINSEFVIEGGNGTQLTLLIPVSNSRNVPLEEPI